MDSFWLSMLGIHWFKEIHFIILKSYFAHYLNLSNLKISSRLEKEETFQEPTCLPSLFNWINFYLIFTIDLKENLLRHLLLQEDRKRSFLWRFFTNTLLCYQEEWISCWVQNRSTLVHCLEIEECSMVLSLLRWFLSYEYI